MSVDNNLYFGPYIKAHYNKQDIERKVNGCENCGTTDNKKFCSKCGDQIKRYSVKKKEKFNFYDIEESVSFSLAQDGYDDEELNKGYDILILDKENHLEDYGPYNYSITPIEITNKTGELLNNYSGDIDIFQKYYKKIDICYGLVRWAT